MKTDEERWASYCEQNRISPMSMNYGAIKAAALHFMHSEREEMVRMVSEMYPGAVQETAEWYMKKEIMDAIKARGEK